ncbi:hypothetical protein RKD46_004276 [Streptomyces pseudovenezuelae]
MSFFTSVVRLAADEDVMTVPMTDSPFFVAAKTRQYLESVPEPVLMPSVPFQPSRVLVFVQVPMVRVLPVLVIVLAV